MGPGLHCVQVSVSEDSSVSCSVYDCDSTHMYVLSDPSARRLVMSCPKQPDASDESGVPMWPCSVLQSVTVLAEHSSEPLGSFVLVVDSQCDSLKGVSLTSLDENVTRVIPLLEDAEFAAAVLQQSTVFTNWPLTWGYVEMQGLQDENVAAVRLCDAVCELLQSDAVKQQICESEVRLCDPNGYTISLTTVANARDFLTELGVPDLPHGVADEGNHLRLFFADADHVALFASSLAEAQEEKNTLHTSGAFDDLLVEIASLS
ncbi:MAG: hypothetical protein MHM6MM_005188 [Cercozoa sp. M6MM]